MSQLPRPLLALLLVAGACAPDGQCTASLWYVDDGSGSEVSAAGDWNGWSRDADPFKRVARGAWRLDLELAPGDYAYALWVDGEPRGDPYAALRDFDPVTGEERPLLRVEDCAAPSLRLERAAVSAAGALDLELALQAGDAPIRSVEAQFEGEDRPVQARRPRGAGRVRLSAEGLAPGKHRLTVRATDRAGRDRALQIPLWVEDQPFSWEGALIYQVLVDRFAGDQGALGPVPAGDDQIARRQGGTLQGLLQVLQSGYFEDLGVDALWLSPLTDNPDGVWEGRDGHTTDSYHGYWPTSPDPRDIEPALGDADDLRALVAEAHARGLRVILDVVPNHVHEEHPYWAEHRDDGWFHLNPDCICGETTCPWSEAIQTCWFTDYLPDIAWEHPDAAAAQVADAVAWVDEYDLDGLRVDAVPMMPRAALRALVWGLRQGRDDRLAPIFTVGETFTGADGASDIAWNLGPNGLSGAFDFPGLWAIRDFSAWGSGDALALDEALGAARAVWAGSGAVMSPFVGNHDLSRFLSEAAGDDLSDPWDHPPAQPSDRAPFQKLLQAQALALSSPGAPVIYYGDELGLAGANDPDCRRTMVFDEALSANQRWTLQRSQRLGQARRRSLALRRGAVETLLADGPVYATRRDAGDGCPAILVINGSDETVAAAVPSPASTVNQFTLPSSQYFDVIEEEGPFLVAQGLLNLSLPPWSARLLLPDDPSCPGALP